MRRANRSVGAVLILLLASVAACSQSKRAAPAPAAPVVGEVNKPGSSLAYEHTVAVRIPADQIPARIEAGRSACVDARFGHCELIRLEQGDGARSAGSLTLRLVPAAVEPVVKLVSEGGTVASHTLRAEDRAEAIADVTRKTEMLTRTRERLSDYANRKDLAIGDRISVERELASIEQQLEEVGNRARDEQRRIDTNLLTLTFSPPYQHDESFGARLREAFGDFDDKLADGIAETVGFVAYALPMLLLAFPLALLWRVLWRRATRGRRPS